MNDLINSVRRIGRYLRPTVTKTPRGGRLRALLPPPRFIDCMELEDRTLLSATPLGVETLVNTQAANSQATFAETTQAVAADASGNYVVAWSSQLQDGAGWGIYAQRFDSAGMAQGGEFLVNTALAQDQQFASVAMTSDGRFVVAWTTDASGDAGIRARVYDAAGVAQTGEIQVNTYTADDQQWQSVAIDDSGNFVVTWTSINQDGGGYGVYARQFDSSGAGQAEFLVSTTTAGDQMRSQVAMSSDGDFVITWEMDLQIGTGFGIFGQRYDSAGARQGGEFLINTTFAGDQRHSAIAMDAAGNFIVTWTSAGQDGSAGGIYAQRFDSLAAAVGGEFLVNTTTAGDQDFSRVALSDSGEFAVSWSSFGQDAAGTWGVYAKQFTAAGTVAQAEFRVNTTLAGDQNYSSVALAPSNSAILVWSGNGAGDADGVLMQRYHFNDAPSLATTGTALSYVENAGAVAVDGALGVTDTDDANLQGATVTISANYINGEDVLSFVDQGGIAGNWNAAIGTLTLSGSSSVANYQAALRSITYTNTSDNPSIAVRTVSFAVNDGTVNSAAATRDITLTAVNDAPALAGIEGPALAYIENGSPLITSSITVSDLDGTDLSSATVQITANYQNGQDLLTFTNTANITASWDAASGTLTLSGVDTLAGYQTALRNVGYTNTSDNPNTAARTVTFRVNDGAANSNTQSRDITLSAVNDAPVVTVPGAQNVNEETALVFSAANGNAVSVSDPDAGGNLVRITLSAANGLITLSQTTGLAFTTGDGAGDATMVFSGSIANVNAALEGLAFTPPSNFTGAASLQVTINDQGNTGGAALNDTDTVAINVSGVNDAPVLAEIAGGSGLSFDGDDFVRVAASPSLAMTGEVTLEAWIFPKIGGDSTQIIINKEGEYEVARFSDGTIHWAFSNTNPGWTWFSTGYVAPALQWTHIAVTYNAGVVNTFASGALVHTHNGAGNIGDTYPALNALTIGGRENAVDQRFVGLIDEVRVWSTARTQGEINATLNQTLAGNEPGLAASWTFDDGQGNLVTDQTANANHGVLGDGVAANQPSWVNAALDEDGLLSVAAAGVLRNAFDIDGDALAAMLVTNAANGNVVMNANGSFSYTPNADFYGVDSFTYQVNDGTVGSNTATFYISVSAVNDAPVNLLPLAQSATEDAPFVLSSGNGNAISIGDVDAAASPIQVTLAASNGVVTLAQTTGLTLISGDGTSDATMSFAGSIADINAALDGLTFVAAGNFAGAAGLQITSNDLASSGAGGARTDSDTVAINFAAVNDGPTAIAPGPQLSQGQSLLFSAAQGNAITLADIDSGGGILELTLIALDGTVSLGSASGISLVQGTGAGDAVMVLRGTLDDLNRALDGLSFQATAANAQLQLTLNDLGNTGIGGAAQSSRSIPLAFAAPLPLPPPPPQSPPDDGGSGDSGAAADDGGASSDLRQPESDAAAAAAPAALVPQPRSQDAGDAERSLASRSVSAPANASVLVAPVSPAVRTYRVNTGELEAAEDRFITQAEVQRAKSPLADASPLMAGFGAEQMVWEDLREIHEALDNVFASRWTYGAIAGLGALSAGYLVWGLQAGSLVTSALSSLPIWGSFDPLPVLEFWERDSKRKAGTKPDEEDPLLQSESDTVLA